MVRTDAVREVYFIGKVDGKACLGECPTVGFCATGNLVQACSTGFAVGGGRQKASPTIEVVEKRASSIVGPATLCRRQCEIV